MPPSQAFDATLWITENMCGGTRLRPETSTAVANFTLMWNLFEDVVCGNHANVRTFEMLAARLAEAPIAEDNLAVLCDCLAFWTFRYREPEGFSARFADLRFRANDQREVVEGVLLGTHGGLNEKLLSLMVIVYRLRNNLFHGLKTIDMLNKQVQNLDTASRCLGALVRATRSHLILN
ncbi:hypothetical protein [Thauera humireducens]|nr:hypothetical protein [Thauera humireducens]